MFGEFEYSMVCRSCGFRSVRSEDFLDLAVSFPPSNLEKPGNVNFTDHMIPDALGENPLGDWIAERQKHRPRLSFSPKKFDWLSEQKQQQQRQ